MSVSGKADTLKKGKLTKFYPKHSNLANSNSQLEQPIIRESKSTYFVKPATAKTKDQKAVIVSRQMAETVANSKNYKDIKIAKQRLYGSYDNFSHFYPETFMTSKEVESLEQKQKGKGCQYQYYLGMAQIAGESDWNLANIGNNKDGNLAVIDIGGPSTVYGKDYIGSFLFWHDLFKNILQKSSINAAQITEFKFLMWVSGAIKNDYFGSISKEKATMSYKTFNDFIKGTVDDVTKHLGDKYQDVINKVKPYNRREFNLALTFINDAKAKEILTKSLIQSCNQALKETGEGKSLYKQITAYIDGATEFYYQAPYAVIEKKHILGGDLNILEKELGVIQDSSFTDFCKLIKSFNNKELSEYLEEKIEQEQEKNGICTASNKHNSPLESKSLFFSKIHRPSPKKIPGLKSDIFSPIFSPGQSTCSSATPNNRITVAKLSLSQLLKPEAPASQYIKNHRMSLAHLLAPYTFGNHR